MATSMQAKTVLRNAMKAGQKSIGCWLTIPHPAVARAMASSAGYNWILIDGEHGLVTDMDYYNLSNAVAQFGVSPIIRVPNAEEYMIKRALDAGAHGVMTPMCHTVEDAKKVVAWNKYPPKGTRGYGPMYSGQAFGVSEGEYAAQADDELVVIVQIESRTAVENVEEIAKVDGLDVLFIGPFDLSKFMNVQFGSAEHEAAIQRVLKAGHDAGKYVAIFCTNGEQAKERLDQGFDMVSVTTDLMALSGDLAKQFATTSGQTLQAKKSGGYS